MNPEGGQQVSAQEARAGSQPALRFSAGHADKLFGDVTVRSLLAAGGVTFPKPNDAGHIESPVEVPVSVLNSIVSRNENRELGAHVFWIVQHTVAQEIANTAPADLSLRTYDKALAVCESNGSITAEQSSMVGSMALGAAETRRKYEAIGQLNSRLLPPEFEIPDMEEIDDTLSKLNDRAKNLGIQAAAQGE